MKIVADYSLQDNEYFFDRHPRSFNSILNFYRTGKLHINEEMCVLAFQVCNPDAKESNNFHVQGDLEYWGIEDSILESCCRDKYDRKLAVVTQEMESECFEMQEDAPEIFPSNCCGK